MSFDPFELEMLSFGSITREESENILRECEVGTFLLRRSATIEQSYSLSVKEKAEGPKPIHHYLITTTKDSNGKLRFKINDRIFFNMEMLISYYKIKKLESVCLKLPAPKQPLFKVVAMHRFDGERINDLLFDRDEILDVIRLQEEGWWVARNALGMVGTIPTNYVKVINKSNNNSTRTSTNSHLSFHKNNPKLLPVPAIVRVTSNRRQNIYDPEFMPLKIGQLIYLMEMKSSGICKGINKETRAMGLFPHTFVEWTDIPPTTA